MADQCGQRGVGAAALVAEVFGASRVVALVALVVVVTVSGSSKVMTAATSAATGAKG